MNSDDHLDGSYARILGFYVADGHVSEPAVFGLPDFSITTLVAHSFFKVGSDSFCLYEKEYKLATPGQWLNVKIYFHDGVYVSNGVDLRVELVSLLTDYAHQYSGTIRSVELLADDSLDSGSVLLNGTVPVLFERDPNTSEKSQMWATGIATDYEAVPFSTSGAIASSFARDLAQPIALNDVPHQDPAIWAVAACIQRYFPGPALR